MSSPIEAFYKSLIEHEDLDIAADAAGFTLKQAEALLAERNPVLLTALQNRKQIGKQLDNKVEYTDIKVTADGQYLVRRPSWYTGQSNNKYIPLAHAIVLPTIRVSDSPGHLTKLPKGYVIYHKDGDKANLDISNLEMVSRGEATRRSNQRRAATDDGNN